VVTATKPVVELFGVEVSDTTQPWQTIVGDQTCPFLGKRCYKTRKSDSSISIGTCTVSDGNPPEPIMICPTRLTDRGKIFNDCMHLLTLHEPGNDLHLIPEVPIPGGQVDYFLVSAKDDKVVDFVGIELQTLDTTGTVWPERQRTLLKLGLTPEDSEAAARTTPYGMNWKHTAKTILVQMHHKAMTFEHVNRKLVLVIQNELLSYMESKFRFSHFHSPATISDTVHLHAYGLKPPGTGRRALTLGSRISTDTDGIGEALGVQAETRLELEAITELLEQRMSDLTLYSSTNAAAAVQQSANVAAPGAEALD